MTTVILNIPEKKENLLKTNFLQGITGVCFNCKGFLFRWCN